MDHLSSSQITLYLMCPRKYKFRYIDKIKPPFKSAALAFGSAMHSAINYLAGEKKRENGVNIAKLISTFRADWEAQKCDEIRFKDNESEAQFLDRGINLLNLVFEEAKNWKIKETEFPFNLPVFDPDTGEVIVPVPLVGYIDLILEPDTLVELKTGIRKWSEDSIRTNLQVSLYHYAYKVIFGGEPDVQLKILLRQKTPRIDTHVAPRSPDNIKWAINLVKEVYEGIEKKVFFPNPGWLCGDCEYDGWCKDFCCDGKGGGACQIVKKGERQSTDLSLCSSEKRPPLTLRR